VGRAIPFEQARALPWPRLTVDDEGRERRANSAREQRRTDMEDAKSREMDRLRERRGAPLKTPSDLDANAARDVGGAMNLLLADAFALYLKTKNFHWHVSGPHFRDYHLLLDEQADQIFAMTDPIAERVRKIGATTLHSIGQIKKMQRVLDNDAEYVEPSDMLAELREDNARLAASMREAHELCDKHRDKATSALLDVWIDETERRAWFLFETTRRPDASGH
jgi:starvation-inducible DNA-binding protein